MKGVLTVFGILFFGQSLASRIRFDNYRVYSVDVEHAEHLKHLKSIESDYDFWKIGKIGQHSDIMVAPHKIEQFEKYIENMNSSIKVNNVQRLIDLERSTVGRQQLGFGWTSYYTYSEIYAWLDSLLLEYPTVLTNILIGTSYEGRQIRAIRLSRKEGNPTIFLESNIHAREWITSSTATWLLNELLNSNDSVVQALSNDYDWIIVPILNVDGFEYTHTDNRLWRKTRQPHSIFCKGADPNRNFDFNWLYNNEGASKNPCSTAFAGPYPFSEPETKALADFYETISASVKLYLSLHSYGQYILIPYGHTFLLAPNYYDMMLIGLKAQTALRTRYGADYILGSVYNALYTATGASMDWAYNVSEPGQILAFAFELRDVRNGEYGFILPAEQIIPNCEEFMDGLKELIAEAAVRNYL